MPIVAFSRGTHIGAKQVAEGVATKLGIPCLSREILVEAAQRLGVPEERLLRATEHAPSLYDRISGEHETYRLFMIAALCQQAARGSFVYHGNVGHLLLGDMPNLLSVRVLAPLELRIASVMERWGYGRAKAERYIRSVDRNRRKWASFLYDVDWRDPALYDLTINLARFSFDEASDLICAVAGLDKFQWTDEKRKKAADIALAALVRSELARDEDVRAANLEIYTDDGAVTVTGSAVSGRIRDAVSEIASAVPGVVSVRCEVSVPADLLAP